MNIKKYLLAALLLFGSQKILAQSNNNGVIDGIEELVTQKQYMVPMSDSVLLATDVFIPQLSDDLAVQNLEIPIAGLTTITIPKLKIANSGLQFMQYPGQDDPYRLPVVFTRTPYDKANPTQGQVEAIMGYCGIVQDMRGRYASGGTYLPMYSDGWNKNGYYSTGHPLDTTFNKIANTHEDGYESVQYIINNLRWDSNQDSVLDETDRLLCNGKIGMIGASALANSQYSAAAVRKIDPDKPGLKCLVPIVGSCEFYHSTGHHNGVYRERIIDGWLRGQVERYDWDMDTPDGSVNNFVHSLSDFGPSVQTPRQAAETDIDFWTTINGAHYPNSDFRASMDVSHAPIDENGNGDKDGTVSRYTNMEVPIYHLTGWWDIFIDGQIETWQNITRHVSQRNKNLQKLVIGPWAHQTIGTRATGDMKIMEDGTDNRYPENVSKLIGASLDNLDVSSVGDLSGSEAIAWFRNFLGSPMIVFPPLNEWQPMGSVLGNQLFIKIPADTLKMTFEEFFNFINGSGPLNNFPISIKGIQFALDSNAVQKISIPATGNSLLGDASGSVLQPPGAIEWDASKPNGVKQVRFYVPGPVNDGDDYNKTVGNYWYAADTFPIPNVERQKVYLHKDGRLSENPHTEDEGAITYLADPNEPVLTHGGPNMIVKTPDNERDSQGQMDFRDPKYVNKVLDRPGQLINDELIYDIVKFESVPMADTFSIAGVAVATIYAKSKPLSSVVPNITNCDFIVRVLDVYPDGRELYVHEGAVNARAREYAKKWAENTVEDPTMEWSNIESDKVYEFKFRMLPIAYTWGRGHKMKVLISSTSYPRYQACPNLPLNDGEFFRRRPYEDKTYVFNGTELYPRKALQTLMFSTEYSPSIDFPVLGKKFTAVDDETVANNNSVQMLVYPNPATDMFAVTADDNKTYTATVYNMIGQTMASKEFVGTASFDVRQLPKGVYTVSIQSKDGLKSFAKKLVKE